MSSPEDGLLEISIYRECAILSRKSTVDDCNFQVENNHSKAG